MRRVHWTLLGLFVVGAVIGGWIALRDNGLLGGLDHDGPLDAFVGNRTGVSCLTKPIEIGLDDLQNLSGSRVTIDRIRPNLASAPTRRDGTPDGMAVSEPQTALIVPVPKVAPHQPPPRRAAAGTVIPPHGTAQVIYAVRFTGTSGGRPIQKGTTITFVLPGMTVDYHVGSRRFREENGIVVQMPCTGRANA